MHVDLYGHACPDASRPNQCYGNEKVRLKKKKYFSPSDACKVP